MAAELWLEVKQLYMTLEQWYDSREWYHYIGYLISTGTDIQDILYSAQGLSKSALRDKLRSDIAKTIRFDGELENVSCVRDSQTIRRILLLFNIESLQASEKTLARFAFNRYKGDQWDLEHIHSIQSEEIPARQRMEWLETLVDGLGECSLCTEARDLMKMDTISDGDFKQFHQKVVREFGYLDDEDEINGIGNMTLLDSETNRAYKNSIFPVKRKYIIDRDKKGVFIPLCTKNVFLKYYSEKTGDMLMWTKQDQKDYIAAINAVLKPYLELEVL